MNKKAIFIVVGVCALLLVGYVVFRFFSSKTPPVSQTTSNDTNVTAIKKVDLSTQPEWVQKLVVTATGGRSANGLKNVTIKADGFPEGMVESVQYVIQYETNNRGAQGALSTKPIVVNGETSFSKIIDFGTCSTKSCVNHEGVVNVDLELNFTSAEGEEFSWSGTLPIL